jgi:hypothetical protein
MRKKCEEKKIFLLSEDMSRIRICGSGSEPKCQGSPTLHDIDMRFVTIGHDLAIKLLKMQQLDDEDDELAYRYLLVLVG